MALMVFLSIILMIGTLTTFTDLKSKKIYNLHLIIGAVLGIAATVYAGLFNHEHVLYHFLNGLIAFLVGLLLLRLELWRGGDAKLFTLYAFLMPYPVNDPTLVPNVINLFACSFIAGTIVLIPVFIKDITINYKAIANDLFQPAKKLALFDAVGTMVFASWILFPVYYLARIANPVIYLTVSYLIFSWGYSFKKKFKKDYIIDFIKTKFIRLFIVFLAGLLMRFWLSPNSLSLPALSRYLFMITFSAALSTCIHTTFSHFKDYQDRVPFAPLLYLGCILSYTPFLTKLTYMVTRWNVLFSR